MHQSELLLFEGLVSKFIHGFKLQSHMLTVLKRWKQCTCISARQEAGLCKDAKDTGVYLANITSAARVGST